MAAVKLDESAPAEVSDMTVEAQHEERAAAKALSSAKEAHDAARSKYVAQFSLPRRAFKHFGTRTKAYRAEHVAPRETQFYEAQARWEVAAWNLRQTEATKETPDSFTDFHESWIGPTTIHGNPMY
mmetsp:Transcript_115961/g.205311  ORF Transcript_115961/g.205311 Transcript_115961/m.205311 type:complete len:126 (+) Transcript_115961:57-434(+)